MSALGAPPAAPVALAEGATMEPATIGPLTRTDLVRYAGAGGDFNPAHHDDEHARAGGFPGVFAMGMLHAGALGMRLARWVGPDNVRSYAVRFTGQVWPGDVLTLRGTVERVERGGGEPLAHLRLSVARGDDEVLQATATARVA